jgi:hypothetical protein
MQSDGNLLGYGANGVRYWSTGMCCRFGATFVLSDTSHHAPSRNSELVRPIAA